MSDKAITSTTQEFLDVYDIVNDMVILKDATVSIILQVGTMNFSLLAEQEQDAVIFTYGSLLNSLNYPIQINIQSQTKDATKYLRLLDEQATKASSDRKSALIKQYRSFVESLIKERNVLQKRFYIVTSAGSAEMGLITPAGLVPGKNTFNASSIEKSILLEKAANVLEPRREHLIAQFNRLGLFARQLNTQEIIQNFYINYNPEAAEGQEISSSENYTTPLVRASFGGKVMQISNQLSTQNPTPQQPPTPQQEPIVSPAAAPVALPNPTTNSDQNQQAVNPEIPPVEEIVTSNSYSDATDTNPNPTQLFTETTPVQAEYQTTTVTEQSTADAIEQIETPLPQPQFSETSPQLPQPVQTPAVEIDLNLDQSLLNQGSPILDSTPTDLNSTDLAQVSSAQAISDLDLKNQPETQLNVTEQPPNSNEFIATPTLDHTPPLITEPTLESPSTNIEDSGSDSTTSATTSTPDFSEEIIPIQNVFDSDDDEKDKVTT